MSPLNASAESGTASVELVAAIPFLLVSVLVVAQIALAGQALWSAAVSARAGARAALVGKDAGAAARKALPPPLRSGARVKGADALSVEVAVPRLLPTMPVLRVSAASALGGGGE